jgi:urea transport system permease protein
VALLVVVVPALVAFVFGYFAFRSRIKGVYFSIITQALTFAAMLLFFRNETGFGGNNGFTDFKRILGYSDHHAEMRVVLFVLTALALMGFFCCCALSGDLSKFGRVLQAIRDAESRVMFIGYNPLVQADDLDHVGHAVRRGRRAVCAAGGHHQPGRDEPGQLDRDRHLGAVGGRATLIGPIIGAFIVNGAKSWFTVTFPEFWLFFLGALFIAVTLFLPDGVVGL